MKVETRSDYRYRRHLRVRRKIKGNADRPRMCVFISNHRMYVQFVDDVASRTLATVSTLKGEVESEKNTVEIAAKLGVAAAKAAKEKGIDAVVFDRAGYAFKGRVKALADAARKAGLKF